MFSTRIVNLNFKRNYTKSALDHEQIPKNIISTNKWATMSNNLTYKSIPTLKIFALGCKKYDVAISDRKKVLNNHFVRLEDSYNHINNILTKETIPQTELLINEIKLLCSDEKNIITDSEEIANIIPVLEKQIEKLRYLASKFDTQKESIVDLSIEKVPSINFVILQEKSN